MTTRSDMPTVEELARFVDTEECYEIAGWIVRELSGRYPISQASGAYLTAKRPADHSWVVHADGTIIDTTHGQFDAGRPILVAASGDPEHDRYVRAEDMTEQQLLETYGDASGVKPGEPGYSGRLV